MEKQPAKLRDQLFFLFFSLSILTSLAGALEGGRVDVGVIRIRTLKKDSMKLIGKGMNSPRNSTDTAW